MSTGTAPSPAALDYAIRVARRLPDLPKRQRQEIEHDVAERVAADGPDTATSIVASHGHPAAYADELRDALGLPPFAVVRRRALRRRAAAVIFALVAAGGAYGLYHRATTVSDHPLRFGGRFTSGAASSVGSVFVLPDRTGVDGTIGIVVTNGTDRTVTIVSVHPFPAVRALGSGLAVGGTDLDPLWAPHARAFPQPGESDNVGYAFDDPHGGDLPATLAPGATTMLQLQGPLAYCVASSGALTIPLELDVTTGGRRLVVSGPELTVRFDGCH